MNTILHSYPSWATPDGESPTANHYRSHHNSLLNALYQKVLVPLSSPANFVANSFMRIFTHINPGEDCSWSVAKVAKIAGLILAIALITPPAIIPIALLVLARLAMTALKPTMMVVINNNLLPPTPAQNDAIRLMSYNTGLMPEPASTLNHLQNPDTRAHAIAEKIIRTNSDVVALQEVFDIGATQALVKSLKAHYPYIIHSVGDKPFGLNSGLFFASKYPIVDAQFHKFTNLAREDALASKGLLLVTLQNDTQLVTIGNTHLQAIDGAPYDTIRQEQLEAVEKLYRDHVTEKPTFLLGDLNMAAKRCTGVGPLGLLSEGGAVYEGSNFCDVHLSDGESPVGSFYDTDKPSSWESDTPEVKAGRIDYILRYNPLGDLDVPRVDINTEFGKISDHLPVTAKVRLRAIAE